MIFSDTEFQVLYVDPSAENGGDGSAPGTPLAALPDTVEDMTDNTCFLIRRTAESAAVNMPVGNTSAITGVLFLGMPKPADAMWTLVPEAARLAWGGDAHDYANVKADTGSDPWSGEERTFQLPALRTLLLHRVYLFRDGTPAYIPIMRFPSDQPTASISLEHCKFGAKGIDLDRADFTAAVGSDNCKSYMEINTAQVFSMRHCIVNQVPAEDYYYGYSYGIYLQNASFITVNDVDCYCTTSQYGGDYGPSMQPVLQLTNGGKTGAYGNYENMRFHILVNKTWGYLPSFFYAACNDHCVLRKVSVDILERRLGEGTPATLSVGQPMIRSHGSREFLIDGITVNLPGCWRIETSGRVVSLSGFANSTVPGVSKSIRNIAINLAETGGFDGERNGNYYDWVKYGTDNIDQYPYGAALELSFSERHYNEGSWEPVSVRDVTVNHPRGVALYSFGCQLRECAVKGTVKMRRTNADLASVESYYPGYAVFAAEATTLRIGTLTLGKANAAVTGGADDPAVGSRYSDSSFIYVDSANGALKGNLGENATNVWNGYNFICGNEIDAGHYVCRSVNYVCDTWNVHRVGGSPAVFKLANNSADGSGGLSLGRQPFQGMRVMPEEPGKYLLRVHCAAKAFTDLSELGRKVVAQVAVPRSGGTFETVFSNAAGRWSRDAESVWENDDDLTAFKLEIPVEVTEAGALDVKIHYSWYSIAGYFYLDPAVELIAEEV
jgi:hypothetical protein